MEQSEVYKELDKFRKFVINESKKNLRKYGKGGGDLEDSLDSRLKVNKNSFELEFWMEDYGIYQDKGVSGTKKKYNTPFSYKQEPPPPKAFDKWIVRKGLTPRNSAGQFTSRKGLQFALSRFIFKNGIKPSLFFTRPFENAYKKLPQDLVEKYGLDAIKLFNETLYNIENG
jgi:hypothetical protein